MKGDDLSLMGLVKSSKYRRSILECLSSKIKMPTEICKTANIRLSHISRFLNEPRVNGLIECINSDEKKGRLYKITPRGLKILDLVKKND